MLASTIGLTNDWIDLQSSTQACPPNPPPHLACGLSQKQVDALLKAHVGLTCPGTKYGNPIVLNGWIISDKKTDTGSFYTNMHGLVDDSGERREPFGECIAYSMSDLYQQSQIAAENARVGSALGNTTTDGEIPNDRGVIPLKKPLKGSAALKFDPKNAENKKVGDRVLMVAANPKTMTSSQIQVCTIIAVAPKAGSKPGTMQTDCDNEAGISGALLLDLPANNDGQVASLRPVGLHKGGYQSAGENQPARPNWNSALAITLDENFNNFVPF